MFHATISCAQSSLALGYSCGPLFVDSHDPADMSAAVAKTLAEAGWYERDGEHFCPIHNPAEAGDVVEIEPVRYRPLGDSGWEARIPGNGHARGLMTANVEIRRCPDAPAPANEETAREPEPVSATDDAAATLSAFLVAATRDDDTHCPPIEAELLELLSERSAVRALAPDSREHEDPFYRPGGVYVSENGWWRFTCKAVVAGVALGVEERLKDGPGMGPARRNVWRSVRAAGCDHEVDPETGEPLDATTAEEE